MDRDVERRLYVGVITRMILAGPVLMLVIVLPEVAPLDWTWVAVALGLFGVVVLNSFLAVRYRSLRGQSWFVLVSTLLASSAAGAAIVASQDPGATVPLALLAAMAFQVVARSPIGFVIFAWIAGVGIFVVARLLLDTPVSHMVTHTVVFAGLTAVLLATIHFLVATARSAQRDAEALAELARRASAARDVEEAVASSLPAIGALTGAARARCVTGPQLDDTIDPRDRRIDLGVGSSGRVELVLEGADRSTFVAAVADLLTPVCERERTLRELVHHSLTDPVTGVSNRRGLDDRIDRADAEGDRTVVMLDLDHFKVFNDTYGHLAGDKLLGRFARVLEEQVRPDDHVSRFGGEEFCLVIDADVETTNRVVDRIRDAWATDPSGVTFSAGLGAERPGSPDPGGDALARADQALYEAKASGRNRSVIWD